MVRCDGWMVRGEELVLREVHGRIDHVLGVREERYP